MPPSDQIAGDLLALGAAMVVIFIDVLTALRKLTSQINPLKYWRFWLLSSLCGVAAAGCSQLATVHWLNDNVAVIKIGNPWRGLPIGLAVPTIIRSKFFNGGKNDTPIGGEYFYNGGRLWAVQDAWNKWNAEKTAFNTLARRQPLISDALLEAQIIAAAQNRLMPSQDRLNAFNSQMNNHVRTKPAGGAAPALFDVYHSGFINVVLDHCGIDFLKQFLP